MKLLQWDPIDELAQVRESLDRHLRDFVARRPRIIEPLTRVPAVDLFTEDGEVVVRAEIPGFDPKDIDISVVGAVLTIKGKCAEEKGVTEREYCLCEIRRGSLARSLKLPYEVKGEQARATFTNGILEIRLPRTTRRS